MAELPEGVQVIFDDEDATEITSGSSVSEPRKDYHKEQYPAYVPPHQRGHNTKTDKFVNYKFEKDKNGQPNPDKEMGVDNMRYQRLKINIPYAVDRTVMNYLKSDFPGLYFHCSDNNNHDHPVSHAVTIIGTRMMQRKMMAGARILDVYGNPNAADSFNKSQEPAAEPKHMKALVDKMGPNDFIREINKWGPVHDVDGQDRYHRGQLRNMISSGALKEYNVLQLVHTLYYIPFQELCDALHAPSDHGPRVAYALVHRHRHDSGTLNRSEQSYEKKQSSIGSLVRQVNVTTGSAYIHPDITPTLFQERKVWMEPEQLMAREQSEKLSSRGLVWDVQMVNYDTWIVQFAPYEERTEESGVNYADFWDEALLDPMSSESTSTPSENTSITSRDMVVTLPARTGRFVCLEYTNQELFDKLRQNVSGKERSRKNFEDLMVTAKHLTDPSSLFGDRPGLKCPPDKLLQTVIAAFMVDVLAERTVFDAIENVQGVLDDHTKSLRMGSTFGKLRFATFADILRTALWGAKNVHSVARAADPVEVALGVTDRLLE